MIHTVPSQTRSLRLEILSTVPAATAFFLLAFAGPAGAQTPVVSPAAQQAHAGITAYAGPSTCVACHQVEAREMFGSLHYQEMAETPDVPNIAGPAGKGLNGAVAMNSYCGTPTTSPRATCATCHVGNGQIPSTQLSAAQLNNIDCMVCHQDAYKRVPAPPYQTITMPGPDGTTHTIQAVIEDDTGFQFMADEAKMTIPLLEAARTVHRPTRASCLRCHAGAGGSDGGKRGDISTVTANPPLTSDFHMSPDGANLSCSDCHDAGGHRVLGRGVDLRPSDSAAGMACSDCHSERPHGDYSAANGTTRDVHAMRVACQSCHIPTFAKDKSTEMTRDWTMAHFSMAACRGQGGWVPSETRASNVVPTYRWFDGTSLANALGQVPVQNAAGEYVLAQPNGSAQSPGARLFPMKVHESNSARQDSSGLLIPHSTFSYFTSGDFDAAVAVGQTLSGLSGPTGVVPVLEYQTINHGVETAANALGCGACHSSYTAGGPVRMNLKADLGYALKAPASQLCSQCHESKSNPGFASVHNKHVRDKRYDCSNCHNFSRPDRGLSRVSAIVPAAPGGPAAQAVSATQATLFWADNSSSEQGFRIERSSDGVSFAEIATVGANVTTTTVGGLSAGQSNYFRVRAYNATGTSGYSEIGRANTDAPQTPTPPAAPAGLTASATSGRVTLAWNTVSDATSYNVKRGAAAGGPFSIVASAVTSTGYADTSVTNGTTYFYVVAAVNAAGESANSAAVSATPQVPLPGVPAGLTASATSGRVTLAWNAVSGATSYNVKRGAAAGGPFSIVASAVTSTGYADTSVTNGTTYFYVVAAVNAAGESANSAAVSATPQVPLPGVPAGLTASATSGRVTLAWNAASGATSYNVKRGAAAGGPFSTVASAVTSTGYADTSVTNGTTYFYVVAAVNAAGESANSAAVSATPQVATAVAAPSALKAEAGDGRAVKLEWKQSSTAGISRNKIYRATSRGGPYVLVATVSARNSFQDSAPSSRTTYYYVVTAVNGAGVESAYSNQVSVRTR